MLTTTATFDLYNMRPNIASSLIVKITGGSTVFYFSDRIISLTDSSIKTQAVVVDFGTLSQKIDLFKKVSSISNVKLKLVNAPYSVATDGTGSVCLSDVLAADNIFNAAVEIYFWYEGLIDIADCLKLFDGLAQPMTKVTPETLELNIFDNSVFYHRTVPTDLIDEATFPASPIQARGKYIPLVYGTFSKNDSGYVGGLVEAYWIEGDTVIVADHVCASVGAVWVFDPNVGKLAKIDSGGWTANLDNGGRTTIAIEAGTKCSVYIYPTEYVAPDDSYYADYPFVDPENSVDRADGTDLSITSPALILDNTECNANMRYHFNESMGDGGDWDAVFAEIWYDTLAPGEITILSWLWEGTSQQASLNMETTDGGDAWNSMDITSGVATDSLTWADLCVTDGTDNRLSILAALSVSGGETIVAVVDQVRYRIDYFPPINISTRIFVECTGRKFGSWIDEGGRSNSYNENDLIENPAHIIESVLRDELGLSASDVDVASFDSVGGDLSSWDIAANIGSQIRSDLLFARIGFQSKTHTFFDSQGTAKIGILDDSGTSSDESFGKDDIERRKEIKISQGDIKQLINSVDVLWTPEIPDGEFGFQRNSSDTNSSSITTHRITKHKTLKAYYIYNDTVAGNFSDHFVASGGYWKDLQEILEVTMANWEYIYLEIGDIIHPNSDINDIVKLFNDDFGSGANAPLFLITEKKIGKDLKFKMQRMGETGGA